MAKKPQRPEAIPVDPADLDPRVVRYHLFAQWQAHEQLAAAAARKGLYLDLPLGPSPDSYDVCLHDTVMRNRTVRKGTLVVFVVDAATRNLLWQGVADGAAVSSKDQIARLRAAVEAMFASFPQDSA